ncbi:MAG: hypothetical protein MOB07_30885 [Acidobacteria bacterium]|nr:hypothetical protein [Acidobacteriota bacterium]
MRGLLRPFWNQAFPIVRRKEEQAHGEYRTKRVILEIYDEMRRAMESGETYQTRLDPPPANGWTPPEIEEDKGTGGRGEGEKGRKRAVQAWRISSFDRKTRGRSPDCSIKSIEAVKVKREWPDCVAVARLR